MLAAHIADTHLGAMQYGVESREVDVYECFREAVAKMLEEHVRVVLHSGDTFHSPRPSIRALKVFQEELKKLRDSGIKVYAIPGGHDMLRRRGLSPLALFDYLGLVMLSRKNPVVKRDDLIIAGVEYIPAAFKGDLLSQLARIEAVVRGECGRKKILLLHQALREAYPPAYELSLREMPRCFNYYALGHIHQSRVINVGDLTAAYPGAIEFFDVQEVVKGGSRGFYIVDISTREPELHFIELESVRPQLVYKVGYERLASEKERILAEVYKLSSRKKPVIHLRVVGRGIERGRVDRLVVKPLSKHSLLVRVHVVEEGGESIEALENLSVEGLLRAKLRDPALASFAMRIVELLSKGGDEALKEAVKEAEKIFEEGLWRRWRK